MSATKSNESIPIDQVIAEYMSLVDAGESVDRERFLREHPETADELQAFWEASDEIEQMAGPRADTDDGRTMLSRIKESGDARDTASATSSRAIAVATP